MEIKNNTNKFTLYNQFARYYDLAYAWKRYDTEAAQIISYVRAKKRNKGNRLLDVACSTGSLLAYLSGPFSCVGVDISKTMLDIARKKKIPGVTFKRSDMINLSLEEKFDVILCPFGSSNYVKTYRNLKRTINGFSRHLNAGGIVIIEPWFTYPTKRSGRQATGYIYKPGLPYMRIYDGKEMKIARIRNSTLRDYIQTIHIHTTIARKNEPTVNFEDIHYVGLFDIKKTMAIMEKAGLEVTFDKRLLSGSFVGIKKA